MKKLTACLVLLALLGALLPAAAVGPAGCISVEVYSEATHRYTAETVDIVRLTLDGQGLFPDVPAVLQGGRTLVPVRMVAEALGAEVLWVNETRQVLLRRNVDTIVLTLGSATAMVNGVQVALPDGVPAAVLRYQGAERTMLPLRFVSEQLGAAVTWTQETYTAHLTRQVSHLCQITRVLAEANAQTVLIATDCPPEYKVLDFGDRVIVDVLGAVLASGFPGIITVDNDLISAVRYAQHESDLYPDYTHTVRVVLDLKKGITFAKNVTVAKREEGILLTTFLTDADHGNIDFKPTTPIDPHKSTVVIDPGHGGSRDGARYENIKEKDINLAVSLKLERILLDKGYNVVMTRRDDRYMDLYDRSDIANAVDADVFVSLHSNAAENKPDYQGIYTYYHPSSKRGAKLATTIQGPLTKATGGIDRGIKDADFVVLRETDMCAVLVEMGFMSCHEELVRLNTAAYQQKLAKGVAEGIVQYLNGLK